MIKIENVDVFGFESAIRGMRNPMNSWDKSDTEYKLILDSKCSEDVEKAKTCGNVLVEIGNNDLKLMQSLVKAGSDHSKFMRMINVTCDITAPLYWWKEFDTYKVGTVRNSCSTMHKIHEKEFTLDDFSHEHICIRQSTDVLKETIDALNVFRDVYLNGGILHHENGNMKCFGKKDKDLWWQMIQLLPSSYNQTRNVMMNYEVLANIYKSRKDHKLDEWKVHKTPEKHEFRNKDFTSGKWGFCDWIEDLPYSELICGNKFDPHNTVVGRRLDAGIID